MATYQNIRHVQARHLPQFEIEHRTVYNEAITVRIDGRWREVFEIWASGDDPAQMFGADAEYTKTIYDAIDYASSCWVVVRYVVEEKSTALEVADALHRFRTCDLVEVQVPEHALLVASQDQPRPSGVWLSKQQLETRGHWRSFVGSLPRWRRSGPRRVDLRPRRLRAGGRPASTEPVQREPR